MIKEIFEKEKQQLEEQLIPINKNITNKLLKELEKLSQDLQKNPESIDKYELGKYIEIISKNQETQEFENYKEQLNALKTLVECKKTTNNSLFNLTKQQENFIKQFALKIQKFLVLHNQIIQKNDILTQQIKIYQTIIEKIENHQSLKQEELLELNRIIQNEDEHEQNKILKSYLQYNIETTNRKTTKEQEKPKLQVSKVTQIKQKPDITIKNKVKDDQSSSKSEEEPKKIYTYDKAIKENYKNTAILQYNENQQIGLEKSENQRKEVVKEAKTISDETIEEEFQDVIENALAFGYYKNKKALIDIIKLILAFGINRTDHSLIDEIISHFSSYQDSRKTNYTIIKEILNDFNIPYTYNKFSRFGNEAENYDPYTGYPEEETYDISSQDDYSENYNKVSNQNYLVRPSEIQFQESSSIRTPEAREKYFSSFSKLK